MYKRTRGSIVIISHQERILDIADKVIVLADGELVEYGSKTDVRRKLLDVRAGCRFTKGAQ
jgi:Fe-S cluster assembly ATP-binding protein